MTTYTTANFTSGSDTKTTSTGAIFNGSVNMQAGDDSVFGTGYQFSQVGAKVTGILSMGAGNDILTGNASPGSVGLFVSSSGVIYGEDGNDTLIGRGANGSFGMYNIQFGSGSIVNMGAGADLIDAGVTTGGGDLLKNAGSILMGDGNDTILTGNIGSGAPGTGIRPASVAGGGTIDMGAGDDIFRGVGNQTLYGGIGNDQVDLMNLAYTPTRLNIIGGPSQRVDVNYSGGVMTTYGFESFKFGSTVITV
jgi:hypothetical protein